MRKWTRKEEELMKILWKLKKGFVKDIVEQYPDPKPHYNTVSSLVRLLQEKGFVGYSQYGNTYEYYPMVSREEYRKSFMKGVISDYFDNFYKNAVAFFVKEKGLKPEELEEILRMISERSSHGGVSALSGQGIGGHRCFLPLLFTVLQQTQAVPV